MPTSILQMETSVVLSPHDKWLVGLGVVEWDKQRG